MSKVKPAAVARPGPGGRPTNDAAPSRSSWNWRGVALIVALTWIAYLPALGGGFVWDDDAYVEHNPTLRDGAGLWAMWFEPRALPQYYPLVHTSFWVEYQVFGPVPAVFHATNIGLHTASALVLWRLLARLNVPGAHLAALLFAVHPVHVESVAWITERKNVLSALLYFGSASLFLRFNGAFEDTRPRHWPSYGLAVGLFLGALLSKTVTATLPPALLVVAWWRRGRITRGDLLAVLPLVVLAVPLGLHTAWLEKHHVGATGPEFEWSLVERLLIAGRAFWFYLAKLVSPHDLTFIYPRWAINARSALQYLYPLATVGLLVVVWGEQHRIGRGPLAALLYFAGTLFPALGFFNVYPMRYSFVADHFQYLASVGVLALAAALLVTVLPRVGQARFVPWIAAASVAALSLCTFNQCLVYTDLETLWRDTLQKNPDCEMASTNLGGYYLEARRFDEALPLLRRSIALNPQSVLAHNHLGAVLGNLGQYEAALVELRRAVQLDPAYSEAKGNLGAVLIDHGDLDEAIQYLRTAIQLQPAEPTFHENLGRALQRKGQADEAQASFEQARRLRGG